MSLDHFVKNKMLEDGHTNTCKPCDRLRKTKWRAKNRERQNKRITEWKKANPDKMQISSRKDSFLKKGLTEEKYREILTLQNNVCKICLKPEGIIRSSGKLQRLAIDHDRKCCPGERVVCGGLCIRGLLCHRCNIALGNFDDDINILKNAILYLQNFEKIIQTEIESYES